MDKLVQQPLTLFLRAFSHGGRGFLAATAMAGFSLVEAGALVPAEDALGAAVASLSPLADQGVALDSGFAKATGELLAAASAYAPGGSPVQSVEVTLGVGEVKRSFLVQGERQACQDGAPESFSSLPLTWSQAAKDERLNPFGVELKASSGQGGAPPSAPLVTDPGQTPASISQPALPAPASPLPTPMGPEREEISGTYGPDWLKTGWPGFPLDYDYFRQNMAQAPQRLRNGYFSGDEEILIVNAHPSIPSLQSRLPGQRLRLVFVAREKSHLTLREAQPVLDTVWLFPDKERGLLIWHANLSVSAEKASQVSQVIAALEPLSSPKAPTAAVWSFAKGGFAEKEPGEAPSVEGAPPEADSQKELSQEEPSQEAPSQEAPSQEDPSQEDPSQEDPSKHASSQTAPAPSDEEASLPPASLEASTAILPLALTADDVVDLAKKRFKDILPEINALLVEKGARPLTENDLAPHLDEARGLVSRLLDSPASPEGDKTLDSLKKVMADSGLSESAIAGVLKASSTPLPTPKSFTKKGEYKKALTKHAKNWAENLGVDAGMGEDLTSFIEAQAVLSDPASSKSDSIDAINDLFLPFFGITPEQIYNVFLRSKTKDLRKRMRDMLQDVGLKKNLATEAENVANRAGPALSGARTLAEKASILRTGASKAEMNLFFPQGAVGKRLDLEIGVLHRVAWSDPKVLSALEKLAEDFPEIHKILHDLLEMCQNAIAPWESLQNVAITLGVKDPDALASIAALDLLNLPPKAAPAAISGDSSKRAENSQNDKSPGDEALSPKPERRRPILASRKDVQKWLSLNPLPAPMAGFDLAGLDLSGLDLSKRDLREADLREANLRQANLSGAVLISASLENSNLSMAKLDQADFSQASMTHVIAQKTSFSSVRLAGANLDMADLNQATVKGLLASGASFSGAKLPRDFKGSTLAGAVFRGTSLNRADFSKCDLGGASFYDCRISNAVFVGANLSGASFLNCKLVGANLSGAVAPGLCLDLDTDLSEASFIGASLKDASIQGVNAALANFSSASCEGANFTLSCLASSDFSASILRSAIFFQTDLSSANLRSADLFKAVLGGANLSGASLASANLHSADLYQTRFDPHTDLAGAELAGTCLVRQGLLGSESEDA